MEPKPTADSWRQASTATWLMSFLLLVAAFGAASLFVQRAVESSIARQHQIIAARGALNAAFEDQLDEETGIRGFAATGDPDFLEPYDAARLRMPGDLDRLTSGLRAVSGDSAAAAAADAGQTNAVWMKTVAAPLARGSVKATVLMQRRGKSLVDHFRSDVMVIDSALEDLSQSEETSTQRDVEGVASLGGLGAIALFVAGAIAAVLQARAARRLEEERGQREAAQRREAEMRTAYETERRIGALLQDAMAQRELPKLRSLQVSARYVPATEQSKLGGDWYEMLALGSDRWLVAMGDIVGHGIEAAVAMNRLRAAVLGAALQDADPAAILSRVNREVIAAKSMPMAAAVVAIVDTAKFRFSYALAGHPPPMLIEPHTPARLLDFGTLPLGVRRNAEYRTKAIQTRPGAMIVLFTDGLIEKSRDVIAGERALLDAADTVAASGNPDPAGAIFKAIFDDGAVADDVAILTLTITGADDASASVVGAAS